VTNSLSAVCYGFGRYVVVGSKGLILTSTNAVDWTSINTGAPFNLNGADAGAVPIQSNGIFHNEPVFVTVGDSGTIMTSPDGLAWTVRFSGTFSDLAAVSVGTGQLLVAVGQSGTVMTSPDIANWTARSSGTSSNLFAVANDAVGLFGAVGQGGVFVAAKDGLQWAPRGIAGSNDLTGLVFASGNFLAVGNAGSIQSGIVWLPRNSPTTAGLNLSGIAYGRGKFVATGIQPHPGGSNVIVSTDNGVDWTTERLGPEGQLTGITYGDTAGFVAVSGSGALLNSSSGPIWTSKVLNSNISFSGVTYGNGIYLAIGTLFPSNPQIGGPQGATFVSTNGIDWTGPTLSDFIPGGAPGRAGATFGNNRFVALSFVNGGSEISSNGLNWVFGSGDFNVRPPIAFGQGMFVARSATSLDGLNWTDTDFGVSSATYLGILTYGDLGFVGVGGHGILTSSDGIVWSTRGIDVSDVSSWKDIAFGNGTYIAVGDAGTVLQTTPLNPLPPPILGGSMTSRGFALSAIAAPGPSYHIQVSTNLVNWTNIFSFSGGQSAVSFIDATATKQSAAFYRIMP
jgi:hypothetical protein